MLGPVRLFARVLAPVSYETAVRLENPLIVSSIKRAKNLSQQKASVEPRKVMDSIAQLNKALMSIEWLDGMNFTSCFYFDDVAEIYFLQFHLWNIMGNQNMAQECFIKGVKEFNRFYNSENGYYECGSYDAMRLQYAQSLFQSSPSMEILKEYIQEMASFLNVKIEVNQEVVLK